MTTQADAATFMSLNTLARRYVKNNDQDALEKARTLYHCGATVNERHRMAWWWNEGCRDYADNMAHLEKLNALLLISP